MSFELPLPFSLCQNTGEGTRGSPGSSASTDRHINVSMAPQKASRPLALEQVSGNRHTPIAIKSKRVIVRIQINTDNAESIVCV